MPLSTPVKNVIRLSIPAILAELSSTLMQYIDSCCQTRLDHKTGTESCALDQGP